MTNSTVTAKKGTKAVKAAKSKAAASKKTAIETSVTKKAGITAAAKKKVTTLSNKKAKELNLETSGRTVVEIIKAIQIAEGNFDCFETAIFDCDQVSCSWRVLCISEM